MILSFTYISFLFQLTFLSFLNGVILLCFIYYSMRKDDKIFSQILCFLFMLFLIYLFRIFSLVCSVVGVFSKQKIWILQYLIFSSSFVLIFSYPFLFYLEGRISSLWVLSSVCSSRWCVFYYMIVRRARKNCHCLFSCISARYLVSPLYLSFPSSIISKVHHLFSDSSPEAQLFQLPLWFHPFLGSSFIASSVNY